MNFNFNRIWRGWFLKYLMCQKTVEMAFNKIFIETSVKKAILIFHWISNIFLFATYICWRELFEIAGNRRVNRAIAAKLVRNTRELFGIFIDIGDTLHVKFAFHFVCGERICEYIYWDFNEIRR